MAEFDEEAWSLAQKDAYRYVPLTSNTPRDDEISYVTVTLLSVLSVIIFMDAIGPVWAGLVTIGLGTATGWYDTRSEWDKHHELLQARYDQYKAVRERPSSRA